MAIDRISRVANSRSMIADVTVAAACAGLYFVLVLALLPVTEYGRALASGAVVFGIVSIVAYRVGRGAFSGRSVLAVAFASAAVLVVPTFPAMGGIGRLAVLVGLFGMQVSVLLWAAFRWEPRGRARDPISLLDAWKVGLFGAAGLSALATIPVLTLVFSGKGQGTRILWVYPAYFAGLLAVATLYWLVEPITHLATGRYLIGLLGGTCVYGAVVPVAGILTEEPMSPTMMLGIAMIAGGLVGPALALDTTSAGVGA